MSKDIVLCYLTERKLQRLGPLHICQGLNFPELEKIAGQTSKVYSFDASNRSRQLPFAIRPCHYEAFHVGRCSFVVAICNGVRALPCRMRRALAG